MAKLQTNWLTDALFKNEMIKIIKLEHHWKFLLSYVKGNYMEKVKSQQKMYNLASTLIPFKKDYLSHLITKRHYVVMVVPSLF